MQGQTQSISFDGREIRLTTGRFAPQAGGSVLVECGDTAVLVTATRSGGREGIDFLPLICDYEERLFYSETPDAMTFIDKVQRQIDWCTCTQ